MKNNDITIKDVAKKANTSISTVSRVLNGLNRVSNKTRKRILKVIDEMEYVPNGVAISMVKKQANMIVIMRDYGIPAIDKYLKSGDWFENNGYNSFCELINLGDPPSAIFATNSCICTGTIKAFHNLNIRIGGEFSLVGFDDNDLAQFVTPKVTVISRPTIEMGRIGATVIIERITGKVIIELPRKITLSTELIVRESVRKIDI
jgi:DNA-binding LacI/PurR family transcriptional regulator